MSTLLINIKIIEFEFYREQVNKIVHVKQKSYSLQKCWYGFYLVAHKTNLLIEQGLFTKSENLCFALKYTIFV